MKLFSLIALCFIQLLVVQEAFAQPSSGDFLLGSNFSASRTTTSYPTHLFPEKERTVTGSFQPQVGIFISPRISVGGLAHLSYSSTKLYPFVHDTLNKVTRNVRLNMGGFLSYYLPLSTNAFWFTSYAFQKGYVAGGIGFTSFVSAQENTFNRKALISHSLNTGIAYFFNPSWHFTVNTSLLSLEYIGEEKNLDYFTKKPFIAVGLNYLIKNEDD